MGRMGEAKKRKQLKTFPGLGADEFQHPHDAAATEALRALPGLDTVVAKVLEYGLERLYYLENIADNVRVTPRMLPRLHKYLGWGCKILDVEEPELYVTLDPIPNAFTFGHKRPFIVLTSGLVDLLGDEELLVRHRPRAGAHQGGARPLHGAGQEHRRRSWRRSGRRRWASARCWARGWWSPLHDWYRKAELTADRAGLLCVQDIDPCINVFMKFAGGGGRLWAEMDRYEFLRQIDAYEEEDRTALGKAYKTFLTVWRTHPFPILRAKELRAWFGDGYPSLVTPLALPPA